MFRHENQPANRLRITLELVLIQYGLVGLSASTEFQVQRIADGLWWSDSGLLWDAAPDPTNQLVEVDPTNFQGLYEYVIPPGEIDIELGKQGYRFVVRETTHQVREHGIIVPGPAEGGVWKEAIADNFDSADDDFANLAVRMLALRQNNMRFVPSAWDVTTKQPTSGEVLIYASKADLLADTGPAWALAIGRYTVAATFDGSGQLTAYTSVRDG